MQSQVEQIVQQVTYWAVSQESILAAALVGSQARGTATAKSDIDLMFLARQPLHFRMSTDWLSKINWGDLYIESWEDKVYGVVWSRHVQLNASNPHRITVELSFGRLSWASITPLDTGTQQVVRDGCRILYDAEGHLSRLVRFVLSQYG
ncbi:hypothetical protein S7335_351 [Synechococcus sp. PCC 7335]|uniref:nucleotidyltransferase domain-containing protein n=1 Tax=Synechococcus sp. (strain ATCC 29403 / PCC 7335) TaxID=91464 RepID=UPI00017EC096|nr:nucleotidyltransferase domain-containing protein [Synechococcus sp. PCC 7335]EDX83172.1 hypothetical protein S7335_351 [Synechococcus sp. PCC 7335]